MLNPQQTALLQAIDELDVAQVQIPLKDVNPNFIDDQAVPPVSKLCDQLFNWWENICEAYEANHPLNEQEKQAQLQPYLDILQALIDADANLHLWDSEELYGPLWDAASAACTPAVRLLLSHNVDPNTRDDEGLTILSSISDLFFDCDFDQIDWSEALPEERATLELLRANGAKMSKELAS